MKRSTFALVRDAALAAAVACAALAAPARAADARLTLTVDGRAVSHSPSAAVVHDDVAYVALDEMIRTFGGVETTHGARVNATINERSASFRPGQRDATIDGKRVAMPADAYRADGHLYVPLRFFIAHLVADGRVTVDRAGGTADVRVPVPTVS